jgi:hypothetical protein
MGGGVHVFIPPSSDGPVDYVLRKAIGDDNDQRGLTVRPRRSRRYAVEVLTDLDFADDIALLSDTHDQAQELLSRVETVAATMGLHMKSSRPSSCSITYLTNKAK